MQNTVGSHYTIDSSIQLPASGVIKRPTAKIGAATTSLTNQVISCHVIPDLLHIADRRETQSPFSSTASNQTVFAHSIYANKVIDDSH
jgi:hypothetical protein